MHYIVYQITNTHNDHIYIGKHITSKLDDGYMGSGRELLRAIARFGRDQFRKVILHECTSEEEMNRIEAKLVTTEFCARKDTYNLCPGGYGGWGYVNQTGKNSRKGKRHSKAALKKMSENRKGKGLGSRPVTKEHAKKIGEANKVALKGKPKSAAHRKKISDAIKASNKRKANIA